MWECKDRCKKASPYAECYSLSSLFLAMVAELSFILISLSSSSAVYLFSQIIKMQIKLIWGAAIIYFSRVHLVIFCRVNNIHFVFFTTTGEVLSDELLEECPCIIFRNCSDTEDSVNSLTVALTNFSLSLVILALFSVLNESTGSGKRMLKSFNSATSRPNSIRKSSNDVPGGLW